MNPCEISSSLADFSSCRSPACQDSIAFEWWLINASYAGWESVVAHRPILLIKWKISSLTMVVHKVNGLCSRRVIPLAATDTVNVNAFWLRVVGFLVPVYTHCHRSLGTNVLVIFCQWYCPSETCTLQNSASPNSFHNFVREDAVCVVAPVSFLCY